MKERHIFKTILEDMAGICYYSIFVTGLVQIVTSLHNSSQTHLVVAEESKPFNLTCMDNSTGNHVLELSKQLPSGQFETLYTLPEIVKPVPPDRVVNPNNHSFTYMFHQAAYSSATIYHCSLMHRGGTVLRETAVVVAKKPVLTGSWHSLNWFWAKEPAEISCVVEYAPPKGINRTLNVQIEIDGVDLNEMRTRRTWRTNSKTIKPVLLKSDNGKKMLCKVTSDQDPTFRVERTGILKVWDKAEFAVMVGGIILAGIIFIVILAYIIYRVKEYYGDPKRDAKADAKTDAKGDTEAVANADAKTDEQADAQAAPLTNSKNGRFRDAGDCQPNSPAGYPTNNPRNTDFTNELTSQKTDPPSANDAKIELNSEPPNATSLPDVPCTSASTSPAGSTTEGKKTQGRTQNTPHRDSIDLKNEAQLNKLFKDNLTKFRDTLVVDSALLMELEESSVLPKHQIDAIKSEKTNIDKILHLMDTLRKRSFEHKQLFLKGLVKTDQTHILIALKLSEATINKVTNMRPSQSRSDLPSTATNPEPSIDEPSTATNPEPSIDEPSTATRPEPSIDEPSTATPPEPSINEPSTATRPEPSIDEPSTATRPEPSINEPSTATRPEPSIDEPSTATRPEPSIDEPSTATRPEPSIDEPSTATRPEPSIDEPSTATRPEPSIDEPSTATRPEPSINEPSTATRPEPSIDEPSTATRPEPSINEPSIVTNPEPSIDLTSTATHPKTSINIPSTATCPKPSINEACTATITETSIDEPSNATRPEPLLNVPSTTTHL